MSPVSSTRVDAPSGSSQCPSPKCVWCSHVQVQQFDITDSVLSVIRDLDIVTKFQLQSRSGKLAAYV